jgi:quaternary ammonium compound-resistance protein SugE
MAWFILVVAGIFEVVWAVALKYSAGFTKLWPTVIFIAAAWLSFACLSYALKNIPMGSAYAVWTGIGAVGIAIIGMVWFSEPVTILRIVCISLIVIGIVGLKVSGSGTNVI